MTGHENYFEGFDEYTSENIFTPMGMDRSSFVFTTDMSNVAMPYLALGQQDVMTTVPALSAGSLFSSAHDMARFMHTILGDGTLDGQRLLQEDTIAYMLQKHTLNVEMPHMPVGYGFGFLHLVSADGLATVGHGGSTIHYHTELIFNLENGLGVFVSTNTAAGARISNPIASTILQSALMEKTGSVPRVEVPEPAVSIDINAVPIEISEEEIEELLAAFEGFYSFDMIGIGNLEMIDGILTWVWISLDMIFELTPMSDGTFSSTMGRLYFMQDEEYKLPMVIVGRMQIPGARLDSIEHLLAPEDFHQWVGVYNVVQRLDNEVVNFTQVAISVNDRGFPMASLISPTAPPQEIMLVLIEDRWFFANMPIRLSMDDDGVASVDVLGAVFVRD